MLLAQLLFATSSYAESIIPFRIHYPKAKHYEIAAVGEDCAIYRTMKARADRQIEYAKSMEAKYAELLVQNRLALEGCARQNGIEDMEEERDDVLVAELCGAFYQNWLKPAARLELLAADLREATQTRDVMAARLQSYCGHISDG